MATLTHYNLAIIIQEQRRGAAVRQLKQEMWQARQEMKNFNRDAAVASDTTADFEDNVESLGTRLKKHLAVAFVLASAAAVAFAKDSIQEFATFDQKLKETYTLIPEASENFKNLLSDDIRAVGLEYGKLTDETLPALYQALSAGVPKENAVDAVALASEAAVAGVSSVSDTMRVGMAIVNAYGGEVYTLEEAYNILFRLVKRGVPTMQDWANNLQHVMSIASESRTPFEDVAAALAVMTKQGDSAKEAAELLGFFLIQVGLEGTSAADTFSEAWGTTYREFIAQGGSLVEALNGMQQHADDTGQTLSSMVGGGTEFYRDLQAARGIMELTGIHMQDLNDELLHFGDTSGAMSEAFETASDNAQYEMDQMKAAWEGLKISFGGLLWDSNLNIASWFGLGPGATGQELVQYATDFFKLLGGGVSEGEAQRIASGFDVTTASMERLLNKIIDLDHAWSFQEFAGGKEERNKQYQESIVQLAQMSSSYEDFVDLLVLTNQTDYLPEGLVDKQVIEHLNQSAQEVWLYAQNAKQAAIEQEALNEQQRIATEVTGILNAANSDASEIMTSIHEANSILFDDWDQWEGMTSLIENIGDAAHSTGEIVHWYALEQTKLTDAQATYFDSFTGHVRDLYSANEDLKNAAGEWRQVIIDNSFEINEVMDQLGADLNQEQRDHMYEIVRTAEEGGEEWLDAWRSLQADLTDTQRYELVEQLSDFIATHGEMQDVFDGDKDKAIAAAEAMVEAIKAIDEDYNNFLLGIAQENIGKRFEEDSWEARLAEAQIQNMLGNISDEELRIFQEQAREAGITQAVLDNMYVKYLDDGKLTTEEVYNLNKAHGVLEGGIGDLTEKGVQAYLDKSLSKTGGYPYVAAVLKHDVVEGVHDVESASTDLVEGGPYEPEFGIDSTQYLIDHTVLFNNIKSLLGPWGIDFYYNMPNTPDVPTPGQTGHSGLTNFVVPGGYPADSFLLGLTSGEIVNVGRAGSKGSGRSPKQVTIAGDNNTFYVMNKDTARLVAHQIAEQKLKRFNRSMGR